MKQHGFTLIAVLSWLSLLGMLLLLSYHYVFGGLKIAQLRRQGMRLRQEESAKLLAIKNSGSIRTGCKTLLDNTDGGRSLCSWRSPEEPGFKLSLLSVQSKVAAESRVLFALPNRTLEIRCVDSQGSLLETRNARPVSEGSLVSSSLCSALPATNEDTVAIWGNLSTSHLSIPNTLKTLVISGYIESKKVEVAGDFTLFVGGDVLIDSYEAGFPQHIGIVSMTGRIETGQVSPTLHPTFVGYNEGFIPPTLSSSQQQLLNPLSHLIRGLTDTVR